MIGSVFKRATRIFRTTNLHSNVVVGAFSSTVDSAAMASVQETQVAKRVVGKKFVIACDGESLTLFHDIKSDVNFNRNLDGKELQVLTKQY